MKASVQKLTNTNYALSATKANLKKNYSYALS